MVIERSQLAAAFALSLCATVAATAQQAGLIRGSVTDADFEVPLPLVQVTIRETNQSVETGEQGNYVFPEVAPGEYTLVFTKDGYDRVLRTRVRVIAGRPTEEDAALFGEFEDMDEFVVQDLELGGASESGLLQLRFESPSLLDSIGADLISRAGASDAAGALRLVSGATVSDGKFAVIRGLPDRYVSSQLNGVRLPSADEDKRAVELDQFPSAVIESLQVSKTFTPDQQGDASGGAVNVVLKGIPDENFVRVKGTYKYNTNVGYRDDFLSYDGGGPSYWGESGAERDVQTDRLGESWLGAVGVSDTGAPLLYKWGVDAGGRMELDDGVTIGGFTSFFYEQDATFFDDGIDDQYWVRTPGAQLTPQFTQGTPEDGDFKSRLFDVTQASQSVRWTWLGTAGIETENHRINASFLYTRVAEDTATLAENTRSKAYYWGPDYDPNDPNHPGNDPSNRDSAPYLRTETLQYDERTTTTFILNGSHTLPTGDWGVGIDDVIAFKDAEFTWTASNSTARLYQPDKRQFGTLFLPRSVIDLGGGAVFELPAEQRPFKPGAVFTLGNLQRTWKDIEEESDQYSLNLKLPFDQWTQTEGYFKFGLFDDRVTRSFDQDSFSNFNDNSSFFGGFGQFWSGAFPSESHPITDGPPFVDVDYRGTQDIFAWYAMADLPMNDAFKLIGGVRLESTDISIVNFPEDDATWFPPGAISEVALNFGDGDVALSEDSVLPSISFQYDPIESVTIRGAFSETIARPVFKELTPILQQEFLGGPIFIGNPELQLASLRNYDLRVDYTPVEGSLISGSFFHKDVTNPIEVVQRISTFTYTTPVNYEKGRLTGFELEFRQDLGLWWEQLAGLTIGANGTYIDSEVTLPADEVARFAAPGIEVPLTTREATNAPEYLYNLFLTYDNPDSGTQVGLFYNVTGDTLVAGAGVTDPNFVPSVYRTPIGILNFTISQKLGDFFKLSFSAKNLLDPTIKEVYRSDFAAGGDVTRRSFTRGIDLSVSLTASIPF